jgi:hypothetical protein
MGKHGLEIEQKGNHWVGHIGGEPAATLDIYEDDDGRAWLIGARTEDGFQRLGYGRALVKAAVEAYGEVLASCASKAEHEQMGGDWDVRWLSQEGAKLVNACIRDGIMRPEWLVNPFLQKEPDD